MTKYTWPRTTDEAVTLVPPDHPHMLLVTRQILDHARAGREAFVNNRHVEARYYRDCCSWLIWRLGVDGLTARNEIRWDGAKYETRLIGRLSSTDARRIRESAQFARRSQSALKNHVACDHVAPRSCVAEVLIRPDWWDVNDDVGGQQFLLAHGEVAILAPHEDGQLNDAGLKADMPPEWWEAPLEAKAAKIHLRYDRALIVVTRYEVPAESRKEAR